jgi:hypothetical protein
MIPAVRSASGPAAAALGCALKKLVGLERTEEREKLALWLWNWVGRIYGSDIYQICTFNQPAGPGVLPGRKVCCTLQGRVWGTTSYTIDCAVGRTPFGCCRDKAQSSAWWGERAIVDATEGPC